MTNLDSSVSFRKQSLGYLSFRLAHLFERRLDERLRPHGVNVGQLRVMFVLWEAMEATQTEIARHLGVAQPTMAKTLGRMQRDGLVAMRPDPSHGKQLLFRLTDKAQSLKPALLSEAHRINQIAATGFSADKFARILGFMARLGDALEQNHIALPVENRKAEIRGTRKSTARRSNAAQRSGT